MDSKTHDGPELDRESLRPSLWNSSPRRYLLMCLSLLGVILGGQFIGCSSSTTERSRDEKAKKAVFQKKVDVKPRASVPARSTKARGR
jgi:hypothetical protein